MFPRRLSPISAGALLLALTCLSPLPGLPATPSGGLPKVSPSLIRSARGGLWSAPATWEGGKVPAAGARVQIRAGHRVTYDLHSDQGIRSIHIAGTLAFAPELDTRLDVGLIKIQPGTDASENGFECDAHLPTAEPSQSRPALEVGTPWQPIDPSHHALIRLVYFPGMDRQSCPAIVCCGGRMEFHGAPLSRTWVKPGAMARAGESSLTLAEPVTGWRVGDHLIITATQRVPTGSTSGTFRPGVRSPHEPGVEQVSAGRDAAATTALAARDAALAAEIAIKFALGPARSTGRLGDTGQDPAANALVGARVGLWAAEQAELRHAPGKDGAVVGVMAARTALAAAETAGGRDASTANAVATARTALSAAEAALARNAPNPVADSAALAAARAAIAAAEAAKISRSPDREAAMKATLLEFVARETQRHPLPAYTEERAIQAIRGATVTLDQPLAHPHLGAGDYRGEVANLSRNVIVESANPAGIRGHTMYHRGSAGSISYAEFRHLGKEGVLGRYSLHFHLAGNTMRGSSVIGASIWDSGNRWLTIHGTNYLVVRDCVGYQSVGHGFYLEDGTEEHNVLDHNLAVQAYGAEPLPKQNLPFDTNNGAGFWWANSRNTFTRNVACECDGYGYRFEASPVAGFDLRLPVQQPDGGTRPVDIRTLSFVRFEENEAHSILYGLNLGEGIDSVGPDLRHPFVVRNLKVWNAQWAFRPNAPSMMVDGLDINGSRYGIFQPIYDHHAYRQLTINQTEVPGGEPIFLIGQIPNGLRFPDPGDRPGFSSRGAVGKRLAASYAPGDKASAEKVTGSSKASAKVLAPAEIKRKFLELQADLLDTSAPAPSNPPLSSAQFPKPLDPVDDQPPTTVITGVGKPDHGRLVVRGTTSDNGSVKQVRVNGRAARPMAPNFAEWEITLEGLHPGALKLTAAAEDAAGNVEKLPHVISVTIPR